MHRKLLRLYSTQVDNAKRLSEHILELSIKIKAPVSYIDQFVNLVIETDKFDGFTVRTGYKSCDPFPQRGARSANVNVGYELPVGRIDGALGPHIDS
jgi:hypothetical protein